MPDQPRLEIIREHEFEEQLAAIIPDVERADEFTAAAEDLLSREPVNGRLAAPELGVWALPMAPVSGRQVTLYYTFDEHAVLLLSIIAD